MSPEEINTAGELTRDDVPLISIRMALQRQMLAGFLARVRGELDQHISAVFYSLTIYSAPKKNSLFKKVPNLTAVNPPPDQIDRWVSQFIKLTRTSGSVWKCR